MEPVTSGRLRRDTRQTHSLEGGEQLSATSAGPCDSKEEHDEISAASARCDIGSGGCYISVHWNAECARLRHELLEHQQRVLHAD